MSGIYIPNVGLPQDGDFELWIAVRKDGSFTYNVRGGWQDGTQKVVPVPLHGDLIDRDALAAKQMEDANLFKGSTFYSDKCRRYEALNAVANIAYAPTIIPASEEET